MITLCHCVSGADIGERVADNEEEAGYLLLALRDYAPDDFGKRIAEYMTDGRRAELLEFLQRLVEQIGGAE